MNLGPYLIEGTDKWGFDKLEISAANFKKILKSISAKEKPKLSNKLGWEWKGKTVTITGANNPITGFHYKYDKYDEPNKGYMGYVGIEGESKAVQAVADMFNKLGNPGGESKHQREYI